MSKALENIDYCMAQVREHDRDRYYIGLFAPEDIRGAICALFAFNQEVAKTRSMVSEAMLGEIRLQWWREALDGIAAGTAREHPVVQAMASTFGNFAQVRPYLDEIIDTWSADFDGESVALNSLERHARGTGGALNVALLLLLDPNADESAQQAARAAGAVWALMGVLRALPAEIANPSSNWRDLITSDGGQNDGNLALALAPTVKRLVEKIDHMLAAETLAKINSSLKLVLAIKSLAALERRAIDRAGDDIMAIDRHMPGQVRKLLTLMKYQFFK